MNPTTDERAESIPCSGHSVSGVRSASRRRRFALQTNAAHLLPGERVAHCCRSPHGACVQLVQHPGKGCVTFAGLQTCGSVWSCPVCSSKISERRRVDLGQALQAAADRGFRVLLVTYTVRHRVADDLRVTVDGIQMARKRLLSGRIASRFTKRFGVVGRVRALEVTHGVNGWHPHIHELLFLAEEGRGAASVPVGTERPPADREELLAELRVAWARSVEAAGLRDVNDHGVDVRFTDLSVADYVAKFGRDRTWGPDHELTKQVLKKGRVGARTPIGLLTDAASNDRSAELWVEYARVFKGRRQLVWSNGLRELLGLGQEKTDEEVASEEEAGGVVVVELHRCEWRIVVGNDARSEVLEAAEVGGAVAVAVLIRCLMGGCLT